MVMPNAHQRTGCMVQAACMLSVSCFRHRTLVADVYRQQIGNTQIGNIVVIKVVTLPEGTGPHRARTSCAYEAESAFYQYLASSPA